MQGVSKVVLLFPLSERGVEAKRNDKGFDILHIC
jgi:hypothetical protein